MGDEGGPCRGAPGGGLRRAAALLLCKTISTGTSEGSKQNNTVFNVKHGNSLLHHVNNHSIDLLKFVYNMKKMIL